MDLSADGPAQVACSSCINSNSNCGKYFPLQAQGKPASGIQVTPNKWTHIAWTKGFGEGYAECFIDGRSAGYPTIPSSWWATSSTVCVGANVKCPTNTDGYHWRGNLSQVCIRNKKRYVDRISTVPNLSYIMGGTDVLFFLGAGLTNMNTGSATQTLTALGTVPTATRLVEDAT